MLHPCCYSQLQSNITFHVNIADPKVWWPFIEIFQLQPVLFEVFTIYWTVAVVLEGAVLSPLLIVMHGIMIAKVTQ